MGSVLQLPCRTVCNGAEFIKDGDGGDVPMRKMILLVAWQWAKGQLKRNQSPKQELNLQPL